MNHYIHNEIELAALCKKYNSVYIYGAGDIGRLTYRRLKSRNINHICFCVTRKDDSVKDCTVDVFEIKELSDTKEVLIVVAVSEFYRKEILAYIEHTLDINYVIVSDKLIRTMRRIDERKLHFQTHIVEHCNLKCRGCYHFSSLAKEEYLPVHEFENDIKRLSELFEGHAEEIILLGGEPLLHPQINEFLDISRSCFPTGEIKILSNGLLLQKMSDLFFESVCKNNIQLWLTKYPVNYDYDSAEKYSTERGVKVHYFNSEPVRTLGHQPIDIGGKQDYQENCFGCYRADECIDLKHGKMYPCIIPAEVKPFCEYFNIELEVSERDYVDIHAVDNALELLEALEEPMPFCRYCNREDIDVFGRIPWETTNYDIREWTE